MASGEYEMYLICMINCDVKTQDGATATNSRNLLTVLRLSLQAVAHTSEALLHLLKLFKKKFYLHQLY